MDEMKRVMKLEAEREAEEKRRQAAETRLLFERSGKLRAMREAAQRREELEFDLKMLAKIKEDLDRQSADELRRKVCFCSPIRYLRVECTVQLSKALETSLPLPRSHCTVLVHISISLL